MIEGHPAIGVLGPGRDPAAGRLTDLARQVGVKLAEAGYAVVVLGSEGVAGAAAEGALETEGRAVAVLRPGTPAPTDERVETFEGSGTLGALDVMLDLVDAAIVLDGDLDAMALVLQVWSYGLAPAAPYRPMVLLGDTWRATVRTLADAARLDPRVRTMVSFSDTADEAVESLRYYVSV